MFDRAKSLAEWGVLLPLQVVVQVFGADDGRFSVLPGSQSVSNKTYLAYHFSREEGWSQLAFVDWFLYDSSSDDVCDISDREITINIRIASDLKVRKLFEVVSVVFKPKLQKTLTKAADAISSLVHSSSDLPDLISDAAFVKDKVVDEDQP